MHKPRSHIGMVMDYLEVKPADMSEYLHIDKTIISKWRTGARKLSYRSQHFGRVVNFLLESDMATGGVRLRSFLNLQYPEGETGSPKQIHALLTAFLSVCDTDSPDTRGQAAQAQEAADFRIYLGVEGRKQAVDALLDAAEQLEAPGSIKILELEQMDWLCRDMAYLKTMVTRLKNLSARQFQIEFAFSTEQSTLTFETFILMTEEFRFDKNIKTYIVETSYLKGMLPRIYALEGHLAAVGLNSMDPAIPIHTNMFFDQINTYKYCKFFDLGVERYGNLAIATSEGQTLDKVLLSIRHLSERKEGLSFYGDYLSIATMEEPLLIEILNDNQIYGNERERCLQFYNNMRHAMEVAAECGSGVFYWNLDALERALSYDFLPEAELGAMVNKHVKKTAKQYRRHLQDTIEYLERHPFVRALLLSGKYQNLSACAWIKNNLWSLSINTTRVSTEYNVCFWEDRHLVNMASKLCTESIRRQPVELKSPDYNLELLKALCQDTSV